jgi:hypothetical protein
LVDNFKGASLKVNFDFSKGNKKFKTINAYTESTYLILSYWTSKKYSSGDQTNPLKVLCFPTIGVGF